MFSRIFFLNSVGKKFYAFETPRLSDLWLLRIPLKQLGCDSLKARHHLSATKVAHVQKIDYCVLYFTLVSLQHYCEPKFVTVPVSGQVAEQ